MNQTDINKYYKLFGYLNLTLSILFIIVSREIELTERIIAGVVINMGYHMFYIFFSSISKDSSRMNNNFNKNVGGIMLKLFSIFGILGSFIIIYVFISKAISLNEYLGLFAICIPFGLLLGSYSLWIGLSNE
ncbi:hypothetical protein [Zobellia galactanivorans]|uniref:Hypothetical membrane protein n=1 Tax=Zobellia galactanivorans (strain DSM 12802 / CCUG 47099 / CIP 106680 / NCIMB 13871 / Dsij) TaxID=63186 RepID=G0L7H0_ZOBGA|nr:hypothetical protein [Zobellia galactanivorans]CAZ97420.1 Hypothetical membrane protein [Zobellia galactanivorans]